MAGDFPHPAVLFHRKGQKKPLDQGTEKQQHEYFEENGSRQRFKNPERARLAERPHVVAQPQGMHGRQPVPPGGQGEAERGSQRPDEERHPTFPGNGRLRRKGVRVRAVGERFLLFHSGIHRWYRGVFGLGAAFPVLGRSLSQVARTQPPGARFPLHAPCPFPEEKDETARASALSGDPPPVNHVRIACTSAQGTAKINTKAIFEFLFNKRLQFRYSTPETTRLARRLPFPPCQRIRRETPSPARRPEYGLHVRPFPR